MSAVQNTNFSATRSSGHLDRLAVDGVCLSTELHAGATVVLATGELDASNIHHLTDYATRHLADGRPFVLDLRPLDFLAAQGMQTLLDIGERCDQHGTDWAVVAGRPVTRLLEICDKNARLPVVASIDEALERFTRPGQARKLFQLVTKSR